MTTYLRRYWIIPLSLLLGIFVGLPLLAPVLMHIGWEISARVIYFIYSWTCHQLPERSFFFFGSRLTYSMAEIQNAWHVTSDPAILRQFIGNQVMGWKVAWSDRMVSMYTSLWLFGILWWPFRLKLKTLPWWGFILFLMPMAVDGTSHFLSDLSGIGLGFRDNNLWLAGITLHILPEAFYVGDAWGSFNSLMRLLTGLMFGFGLVWYTYPYFDKLINPVSQSMEKGVISLQTKTNENLTHEPRE